MWFYALLFGFPASWWTAGKVTGHVPRPLLLGSGLLLLLLIGLRHGVGGDWHSYWLFHERARWYPAEAALLVSDPGYMAINILVAHAGLNLAFVNLACAALLISGVLVFSRLQPRPWLALLAATPILLIVVGMTTTRQSAAIGIELLALAAFLRRRPGAGAAALILAFAFHWSAAVLLPLILFMFTPERQRRPMFLALAVLAGIAAGGLWLFQEARSHQPPAGGALFRLLPSVLAVLLLLVFRKRMDMTPAQAAIALYLALLTLFCLAAWPASSVAADRFGHYSIPLQMLVFSALPGALRVRWRPAAEAAVTLLFVGIFAGWMLLGSYTACLTPYRSYLQAPSTLLAPEPLQPAC
jgi:hypothetical protein